MANEDLGTGTVTIEISDSAADQSLEQLAEKIERRLDNAARLAGLRMERRINAAFRRINPAIVEIGADFRRFYAQLRSQLDLDDIEVEVPAVPNVNRAQWRRMIREAMAGITIPVRVVPDTTGFDRAVREINTPTIRAEVETNVDNDRLTRSLGSIAGAVTRTLGILGKLAAGALAFGAIGISAAAATQSILAFSAALAPAAGIVAALPAVILGFVAANLALKLALSGVGDAFKAGLTGNAKEFEKALKGLSPAAQAAAREVRALKPQFEALKTTVQDSFFKQFEGQITATAKALGGPLKTGLSGISAEFGRAANNVLGYVSGAQGAANVTSILTGTRLAVAGLADGSNKLTAGFLQVAAAVSEAFGPELNSGIAGITERFGTFLQNAAASGDAVRWVDRALDTFAQLGDILGNLGGIISGVFDAAEATTGGFLANIQTVTQSLETFVKSAEGQTALTNIFRTMAVVAAQLGPIFAALATQIGAIAPLLTPIFLSAGPAIVAVIQGLGAVAQAVLPGIQTLFAGITTAIHTIVSSGALTAIGTAFGAILEAITPILPVIGELVATLGAALAPVLTALAPVIGAVVGVISTLLTAISPLLPVVGQLIAQLGPIFTPIITALGTVFAALAPVVQTVANILSSVLGPILAVLPSLIAPFMDQISKLAAQFLPLFNDLLIKLQPSLVLVSQAVVKVAEALIPVITQIVTLAGKIIGALMPILGPLINLLAELAAIFAGQVARVLTAIVVPALNVVAALLRGDFSGAFRALKELVGNVISFVKDQFTKLPGQILGAVANFGSLLVSAGRDLIQGMINGIKQMAGSLVDSAKGVVSGAINGAKSLLGIKSPSRVFYVIGTQTGQGLVNGLDAMASKVGDAASNMAAAAVAPFTDLSVNGPTVNGMNSGAALSAITQPFGNGSSRGLTTTATSRQTVTQGGTSPAGGPAIQNTFNITEVGNATATAERVVNRMVAASGVYL